MNKKKIVWVCFIFKKNHPIHKSWAEAINTDLEVGSVPTWVPFKMNRFVNQVFSTLFSFLIPPADIYILNGIGSLPATLFKKDCKRVLINSDPFFYNYPKLKGLSKKWADFLVSKVDAIISTSKMMEKLAKKYLHVPHEIVLPFVNSKKYYNLNPNLKSENICNIAGLRHSKGIDILIKSYGLIKKKLKNSKLFLISGHKALENKKLLNLSGIVSFGYCNPSPYLKRCGLYLNLARIEPFGVNILEAMASGIPPIISKNCGAADIVRKVDPWLITSLNPKEIAEKTIKLQSDMKRKMILSKKCKKEALKYTQQSSNAKFKLALIRILSNIKSE